MSAAGGLPWTGALLARILRLGAWLAGCKAPGMHLQTLCKLVFTAMAALSISGAPGCKTGGETGSGGGGSPAGCGPGETPRAAGEGCCPAGTLPLEDGRCLTAGVQESGCPAGEV